MKEQSLANRYNLYIMLKPVCIEKYTGIYSGTVYMRTNTHYASFYITANEKKNTLMPESHCIYFMP